MQFSCLILDGIFKPSDNIIIWEDFFSDCDQISTTSFPKIKENTGSCSESWRKLTAKPVVNPEASSVCFFWFESII